MTAPKDIVPIIDWSGEETGKYTLVSVAELAQLVQALTDAQALLGDSWRHRQIKADSRFDERTQLQLCMRDKYFHGKRYPLTKL